MTIPRGIRNNNPGNLDWRAENPWHGSIGVESMADGSKGRFATFKSPLYGLRAMMRVLIRYQTHHGLKSIGQIVGRYAPSIENDTFNYARFVSKQMTVGVNAELDLKNEDVLVALTRAMVRHECGPAPADTPFDWYPVETYKAAAKMALGKE
jgi:hypothetical protein